MKSIEPLQKTHQEEEAISSVRKIWSWPSSAENLIMHWRWMAITRAEI
jgi:hypothetical protein